VNSWQAFLVESKLWRNGVSFGPIALLSHHVEQRPSSTLGLFFSAFGYTAPAIESAQYFHSTRVLMFDGSDLRKAIQQRDLVQLVRENWISAVKFGDPYYRRNV
jgi:hypothetical protein